MKTQFAVFSQIVAVPAGVGYANKQNAKTVRFPVCLDANISNEISGYTLFGV